MSRSTHSAPPALPRRKRAAVSSAGFANAVCTCSDCSCPHCLVYNCSPQPDFAARLFEPVEVMEAIANAPAAPVSREKAGKAAHKITAPVYRVKLVRAGSHSLQNRLTLRHPSDAVELLEKHFSGADREHFVCVLLDTKNHLIGISTISIGDLGSTLVHPREVFKPALLANAASVLLAHNHPSGNAEPSPEDIAVTRRLSAAGDLLGIEVIDHLILGEPGRWVSLRQRELYVPCPDARYSTAPDGQGSLGFNGSSVRVQSFPGGPTIIGETGNRRGVVRGIGAGNAYQP